MEETQSGAFAHWKRNATFFLGGQMVSMIGSSLVGFVISWHVAKVTNSGVQVSIVYACMFIPQLLISFFAGVWADRHSRKMLIMTADAFIAIVTLVVAILYHSGREYMWLLYVATVARSFGAGIQSPAVSAAIPQIVPTDQLMRINSLNGTLMSIVNLATPAIAAYVLSLGELSYILMIDVVTALIGIGILACIPIPRIARADLLVAANSNETANDARPSAFDDLKRGLRYALDHPFVKKLLMLFVVFSILIVPAALLNVLMVRRVFGSSDYFLMWNEISFAIGMIAGGLLLSLWGGFKNRLRTLFFGCIAFGLLTVAIGYADVFWIYLIIIGLTGATVPLFNSPVMVLLQEKVEPQMQGRIFSLIGMVSSATMPIGMLFFGPLADAIRIQTLMIVTGAALTIFSAAELLDRKFMAEGVAPIASEEAANEETPADFVPQSSGCQEDTP